jgi:hypothetical protein
MFVKTNGFNNVLLSVIIKDNDIPMFYTKHNAHTSKFLPHQANDIKPEEIHQPEQKAPVLLTAEEKRMAITQPLPKISLAEEKTNVHIGPPKPAVFEYIPTKANNISSFDIGVDSPIIPPWLKLLNKLGIIKNPISKINPLANYHLKEIINFTKKTHLLKFTDVKIICGVKSSEAKRYLAHLIKKKFLTKHGSGNKTFYKPFIE